MEIQKISLWIIVFYFIVYLIVHVGLGLALKRLEKIKEDGQEIAESKIKWAKQIFMWWPAVYVIILLLVFEGY